MGSNPEVRTYITPVASVKNTSMRIAHSFGLVYWYVINTHLLMLIESKTMSRMLQFFNQTIYRKVFPMCKLLGMCLPVHGV